ncbi:MAG: ubiquinone biosynthesis regulatory protein kinase UbiB [Gammaproteobacteria bacterium]|nr:ubiquinone biosynthesis regulatory protein kinase UbiB [Gammaproteobacteria bacterium]
MSRIARGFRILVTVMRYRLADIVESLAPATPLIRFSPFRLLPKSKTPPAARFRAALEDLGPVFIKFGQILSTRRDLLPTDYADELAKLQDKVPPFDSDVAVARIERGLGAPIGELFASFQREPIASASLAQVHAATLESGDEVVVKVIRPGIEKLIKKDLQLIFTIANLLERFSSEARRLRLTEVVGDYQHTIFDELNLLLEAANTSTLRRNFAESDLLYVPKVYWELCRENILVLEHIHAVPISDVERLKAAGTNMKVLAERGVETFFIQVFRDNFFHADMHPGNIFVDVNNPAEPSYIAIDCAIIGHLSEEDQTYLARNLLAFFNRDYKQIARLQSESGWIPEGTDAAEFEAVIRQLCEPIFEKPLKDISFGHFLVALFRTARKFNMEVQPQLVLLQKTLLNIEGLGRQLYPELDLWHTAKPFMERWMKERYGPAALFRQLADQAPSLVETLPRLPELLMTATKRLNELDRLAADQRTAMTQLTTAINAQHRSARVKRAVGAVLIVAGLGLLWRPLTEVIQNGGDTITITMGVVAAVAGSLLVGRA